MGFICLLPLFSIILSFLGKSSILPYIMILVAIINIGYEFIPIGLNEQEQLNKRLKIEKMIIVIWIIIFLLFDLVLMFFTAENILDSTIMGFFSMGYVLAPTIIVIIETILCVVEYIKKAEVNNENNDKIATGKVKDL